MEHKQAGWQTQEAAFLCINNCGYFGKAETMNMCSVCYKNMVKKQEETQEKAALSIESIMNCSRSNNGEEPVVPCDLDIATSIKNSSGSNNGKEPVVLSDLDITTSIVNSSGSSSEKEHVVSSMLDIATSIINSINGKEPVLSSDLDIATSLQLPALETIQSTDVSISSEVTAVKAKEGPSRCSSCRKRVGLTGFTCRCGNLFCAMHRHSENHDCQYDYRESGRDAIAKANPVIKSAKLERI